jgi:hypothetical protein
MGFYGRTPNPPRAVEFWSRVVTRLNSPDMANILHGANRIFRRDQAGAERPPADPTEVWGRGVVSPIVRLYGEPESRPDRSREVTWAVRFDVFSPGGLSGYDPAITLEAAHLEAFHRLQGWTPTGMLRANVTHPIWRLRDPQAVPLWDDDYGVWFMSAEYRTYLMPA